MNDDSRRRAALYALGSAVLFGASPPFAKLLLPSAGPLVVASLLYLGAGIALSAFGLLRVSRRGEEARLRASDAPLVAAIILFGGILGPIAMLAGIARISAVLASLLLNLEAPFTAILGILFFGDQLGRREALASALVFVGAAVLSGAPSGGGDVSGVLAIVAACGSWAIDNNLTQRLSVRDPVAVARVKSLGAGAFMLGLVAWRGDPLPPPLVSVATLALGVVSYGASLVLAVRAMRALGAARQAAFFAAAPFIGALIAIPLLGERPGLEVAAAGALIVAGIVLLVAERHAHWHAHDPLEHDHVHVHDEHHTHPHEPGSPPAEPHSHRHRHAPLAHAHLHVPDVHHRHRH
jgi:drug/metabolite transporter (DMT)-like permease